MARLLIEGGHPIAGTVRPAGNKNAAMPMICAALLTDQPVVLHNVPRIGDVDNLLLLLQGLGVDVAWQGPNTLHLHARTLGLAEPDPALFRQLRGSLTLMGPMLGRTGTFRVAGGVPWGWSSLARGIPSRFRSTVLCKVGMCFWTKPR